MVTNQSSATAELAIEFLKRNKGKNKNKNRNQKIKRKIIAITRTSEITPPAESPTKKRIYTNSKQ